MHSRQEQTRSSNPTRSNVHSHRTLSRRMTGPASVAQRLQRQIGNQATQRMLRAKRRSIEIADRPGNIVQTKLDMTQEPNAPVVANDESKDEALMPEASATMSGESLIDLDEEEPTAQSDAELDDDKAGAASRAPRVPLENGLQDLGRIATASYGDSNVASSDAFPQAFTNGGQTAFVAWGGGGGAGAHGNEEAGTIQSLVAPDYQSRSLGWTENSEAWIRTGTGNVDVTRSWTGITSGDQGNGHFVTPAAAARINRHETLHVTSSRSHYNRHLQPLLSRIHDYKPRPGGGGNVATGYLQSQARSALSGIIRWSASISSFQNADRADNRPGGSVDVADLASGTYPVDSGPGNVGGTAFQHRIHLPGEPTPT